MPFKKIKPVLLAAIISAVISALAGYFIFELDAGFLPFPLLAGMSFTLIQDGKRSLEYINKLIIGSLVFGFLALFLIFSRLYLISNFFYDSGFPFWPLYNPPEYLAFSLIFSFVSFLGGLSGLVIKGLYIIIKKHK